MTRDDDHARLLVSNLLFLERPLSSDQANNFKVEDELETYKNWRLGRGTMTMFAKRGSETGAQGSLCFLSG